MLNAIESFLHVFNLYINSKTEHTFIVLAFVLLLKIRVAIYLILKISFSTVIVLYGDKNEKLKELFSD